MNQEEIKKKQKRVMIYVMIISLICVVGVSYAFFTAGMSSETSTTVRADAGTMKITYDGGANINLAGIYPKDDVWATKTITVTGNNTTDAEMYYKLTLVVDSNTFKTDDPLQYELVSTNTSTNGEIIPNISKTDITGTSIELGSGKFAKANNASHIYELKIYYPKKATSQNANQGATFNAHVEITSAKVPTVITLAKAILANNEVKTPLTTPGAEVSAYKESEVTTTSSVSVDTTEQTYYFTYGTGWEANGTKFNLTGATVTSDTYANSYSSLVGKYLIDSYIPETSSSSAGTIKPTTNLSAVYYVVSATQDSFTYKVLGSNRNITESLLASTEDDYGTSYYFRGAVKNNYVQFANKCWRIVRIGGDGSVKLILHNDNTEGAANPCSSANNSTSAAFARYSGGEYISAFNTKGDDNAYVGFMYGTPGSSTYAATHANTNKSTVLTNLETWYNSNLKTYENLIEDNVFCTDKTNKTDTTYNPFKWSNVNGLGYSKNTTFYRATQRLVSYNDNAGGTGPSLKCNGEFNKVISKVGLMTADEQSFAGYARNQYNTATYLQENATDTYWWSLSPGDFSGTDAGVWAVVGSNGMFGTGYVYRPRGVRPLISLVSSTTISGGSGTSEDPYVINQK